MRGKQSGKGVLMLGLVAVLLLSLPFAAAAQTTTTGSASTAAATTNGISNPKEGAALSGTVEVRGYASSPDFMKWQLDLLPNGDPSAAIFLAVGETPGAFTYSFDTSNLPSGDHALRLRVVRQDSNYDEFMTHFTIGKAAAAGDAATGATATTGTATGTTTGTTAATTGKAGTATTGTAAATGAGVTTNGLATPREGQNISGQYVVRGYASDPNFMKWQLDLLPNGDPNSAAFLAFGTNSGVFTYTLDATNLPAGQHTLRLRVVRNDSNYSEYTTNFTIGKAAATGATTGSAATTASGGTTAATKPSTTGTITSTVSGGTSAAAATGVGVTSNGLAAPTEGQTISGQFVVKGYASDPNFARWQLDLLPNGDATQAAFLAIGENMGVFTYTLDTTNLPAGEHALRLRVVRSDSNYSEYMTHFKIAK